MPRIQFELIGEQMQESKDDDPNRFLLFRISIRLQQQQKKTTTTTKKHDISLEIVCTNGPDMQK